jgi:hypothetical protein
MHVPSCRGKDHDVAKHTRRPQRRQAHPSKSSLEHRQRRPPKKVVSAVNLVVSSPTFGEPALGQRLLADDLVVSSPTFGEPALGQRLLADDLMISSPTLGEPALGQRRWRTVRSAARREGRPATDPALIHELQAMLEPWLQEKKAKGQKPKQDPDCIDFVLDQLRRLNRVVGRTTVERKVVRPAHQKLWPR